MPVHKSHELYDIDELYWLVVWNMTFMTSRHIWECHHPN